MRTRITVFSIALVAIGILDTGADGFGDDQPLLKTPQSERCQGDFEPLPGWKWLMKPSRLQRGTLTSEGISIDNTTYVIATAVEENKSGALIIIMSSSPSGAASFRPVVFDAERNRHFPRCWAGAGPLSRYVLDPHQLPVEKVAYFGIEYQDAQGRKVMGDKAREFAGNSGIEVPPWPELEQVYDYSFTTTDGRKLSMCDLRGKVVVIDCWATWCGPCMRKMPDLKRLYDELHGDGLEIIGVNFDYTTDGPKKAIESLAIPWPQVFPPRDRQGSALWYTAFGIRALPRIMLFDRQGVFRAECGLGDLEAKVRELIR